MAHNPLSAPTDRTLLAKFLCHFGISDTGDPRALLRDVATMFSRLPYENLSKVLRLAERGSVSQALRGPDEVIDDHLTLGTGGTCFSLTAALLHLLRSLGWQAEPILADRRYGVNTHCALLVWIEGVPHLLDPGYLIVDPIPLTTNSPQRIVTSFNELILTPNAGGDRIDLATRSQGQQTQRLTFKTQPVDVGEFLTVWEDSFDWDMMQYPVLTRVAGAQQIYLQGNRVQRRGHDSLQKMEVSPAEIADRIVAEFGLDRATVLKAMNLFSDDKTRPS